ncbi:MAG: hypothetical protein MZV64_05020 [Ignavibacteriales bacterium]|nr:hypothetical protein [Ignavibacteriales bacterium]
MRLTESSFRQAHAGGRPAAPGGRSAVPPYHGRRASFGCALGGLDVLSGQRGQTRQARGRLAAGAF